MSKKKRAAHSLPHKYMRVPWKSRKTADAVYYIWKCMLAGCSHYVPRELALGALTICWRCGREFQMTAATLDLKKPHCLLCTKSRDGKASIEDVAANLDKILEM